ncbi:hypothetical protein P175DRAFT_0491539 [Aspergillus ochraceoroseus IBT 24754]|nr:uncharacterized protein P175DRAFT_0491539 [Aspergillus ochraceoroseus IBT 24754]PTU23144.1 hypothetical protein P175DRAFT_0491539 [Aspergillus ochraceoroseus IBT 24754]
MDLPPEKGGGEEPSDAASEEITYPAHTPYDSPPLPSACDILQPLSLYSPLPSSGYLAAVLARERRLRMDQDYQQGDQLNTNPDTKCSSGHRPAYTPSVAFGVNHSRQNSSSGPGSSSTEQSEEPLQATSPPTGGWTVEGQGLGPPSSPLSGEIQSVQRHNHGVEFLHEVDEEGVRTWRRWVVEYS